MNDLLPDEVERWQQLEHTAHEVLSAYGYHEIRLPLVEKSELFARSIGNQTDIVEKEMYSFEDRNGENLTLRPEGTAGCVRAGIENGLLHNQIQRLWYSGPMFRHERPQKGRYRQFYQIGVEVFGIDTPDIDTELMILCNHLWRRLKLEGLTLELNTLGTPESRAIYRKHLVDYLTAHRNQLDEDSVRRLEKNPLRILDSKNPDMREVIRGAPHLHEYLDAASRSHFEEVCNNLRLQGVPFTVNPLLVRGLDYYTRTVFEWTTTELGAQATVCAGGRYDGLVELLGGKSTPAAGFAMGLERLVELWSKSKNVFTPHVPDAYLVLLGVEAERKGMVFAEMLRQAGLKIECNCGGGGLKAQMKRADRSRARLALILGDEEVQQDTVSVKNLLNGTQDSVKQSKVIDFLFKAARGNA